MTTGKATLLLLLTGVTPLLGCGSPSKPEPDTGSRWLPDVQGAPIELNTRPEVLDIAQLEFERSTGNGRLIEYFSHPDPALRRRAAVALGRLPYPELGDEVTDALCRGLEDSDIDVRLAAAFALGQRADPRALGVLEAYRNDVDPQLRARVVEAASWVSNAETNKYLLLALRDSDLQVQIEAAVATARWDPDAPGAESVDRALLDALRPYAISPGRTSRTAVEAELVWRILYALSRRGSDLGRGAFLEYAGSDVPLDRLFAMRGLARIEGDAETVDAASRTLVGETKTDDWRIAFEATGALGRFSDPAGLPALTAAAEHPSVHVRAGAMEALGNFERDSTSVKLLNRGVVDLSPEVRNAALSSLVRVLPPGEAVERLQASAQSGEVVLRLGAARAATLSEAPGAAAVLHGLALDKNPLVAATAIEGLGSHMNPETRAFLHDVLGTEDNGLRLAAVLALREAPDPADVAPLMRAFETSEGDVSAEVSFNVLENLGDIRGDEARQFVSQATSDERSQVSQTAQLVLAEDFDTDVDIEPAPARDPGPVPFPGREFPDWTHNPLLEISTSRGEMIFELFPDEAPVHVYNFIELARRGEYDGLLFHRVVPDFVIQGGDYRGDGNGARPWRGAALPQEFGPRKFTRGSLGMPRNQDVDSGGSQFFVTHRPTPHLDGRYTIFGELRGGGQVLDRIEVGDRILGVRILR